MWTIRQYQINSSLMTNMISREKAINLILDVIPSNGLVITCNGKIGREIWELRQQREEPNEDFIMVGSMGCALAIAVGAAMNTKKEVFCILGDGNFLMKMGTLATYRKYLPRNLKIYVLNNGVHDSTGAQPTAFEAVKNQLPWNAMFKLFEVAPGARHDLGRPTKSAIEIKEAFMKKAMR